MLNKEFVFSLNTLKSFGIVSQRVRNMTLLLKFSHFPWVKLLKLLFSSQLISSEVDVLVDVQQC